MSGPRRDGAPDELGLAEVAWQLRTTLASAADVPVHGDDAVLSAIRRRSTQRRRTKRVLSTSVAAFALSLSTLAVVKGGQAAIDHNLARREESPAITPGHASDSEAVATGRGPKKDEGERSKDPEEHCRPDHRSATPCPTTTVPVTDPTVDSPDDPGVPTTVEPSAPPTTTSRQPGGGPAVTTSTPPTQPTTSKPPAGGPTVVCPDIDAGVPPTDPECLLRAYNAGQNARLVVFVTDSATGAPRLRGWSLMNGLIFVEVQKANGQLKNDRYQCADLTYAGTGPEWYVITPQCTLTAS